MNVFMRVLIVGFAYAAVVVGAGNASGMEPLFYYTTYGIKGTFGVLFATLLYGYIGYMIVRIGQKLQTRNHKEAIYLLGGKYIGRLIDYLIIFMMFGTGVAMLAGSGALFKQQYDLPYGLGAAIMTVLIGLTIMMRLRKVVIAIGAITPILVALTLTVVVYSLATKTETFAELEPYLLQTQDVLPGTLPNWFIAALNHVFMMTVAGIGMSLVIGGDEKSAKVAAYGGLIGGLLIGIVLSMGHFALFAKIKTFTSIVDGKMIIAEMPTLAIMSEYSPFLTSVLNFVALGMIYNTGVSMFYVFVARFVEMETPISRIYIVGTMIIAFIASFIGFVKLIGYFYPIVGYIGIVVVGMVIYAPYRIRKLEREGRLKEVDGVLSIKTS